MQLSETKSDHKRALQISAYYLWQQRGCPLGTPEIDWFLAEELAGKEREDASARVAIVAVAEVMGSALGSIAGVVASVGRVPSQ